MSNENWNEEDPCAPERDASECLEKGRMGFFEAYHPIYYAPGIGPKHSGRCQVSNNSFAQKWSVWTPCDPDLVVMRQCSARVGPLLRILWMRFDLVDAAMEDDMVELTRLAPEQVSWAWKT